MRMDIPAVLLVNLGTPANPTPAAVRTFLRTFLSDRRVVEMSPLLWRPILEGIILRVRPRHSAQLYQSVWNIDGITGSPLQYWSERQRDALAQRFGESVHVALAMRCSKPTIREALSDLRDQGYQQVLVVPLYPQYAASTVATVNDEVARWLLAERDHMAISVLHSYPDFPPYIEALALAVEKHWEAHGTLDCARGDRLLLSFHSIPLAVHKAGEPYRRECELTAQLLAQRLNLDIVTVEGVCDESVTDSGKSGVDTAGPANGDTASGDGGGRGDLGDGDECNILSDGGCGGLSVTFQSVFGPAKWIGPATIDTVRALGRAHAQRVDIICPGFTADCLETLQEINMLNREEFKRAGGGEFHYIPWANAEQPWLEALERLVRRELPARYGLA